MSFGDNLRALIEERDITQKELAKKLNIAPSTLGSYVQNVREPDFATLKMFANFFDVSTDYLLDHSVKECSTRQENELLRVFRSLSEEQQYICIEQSKVFMLVNQKRKEETYQRLFINTMPTLFLLFSGRCRQVPPVLLLDHAPAGIPNYGISYSSLSMTNIVHFEYKKT